MALFKFFFSCIIAMSFPFGEGEAVPEIAGQVAGQVGCGEFIVDAQDHC